MSGHLKFFTLLSLFTLFILRTYGQAETVLIRNIPFTFKHIHTAGNVDSNESLEIYKGKKKLLTHIIAQSDGDCNSAIIELGTFEVKDSAIIFYSYWTHAGDAPVSPYGVRRQIYVVNKDGSLHFIKGEIYIETSREGWTENKGIKFLFEKPKTESDKKQLKEYIVSIEKEYNATFVLEPMKTKLFEIVRTKLSKEIKNATKNWEKTEAFQGYRL